MTRRTQWGEAWVYFQRMMAEGDRSGGCWLWPYGRTSSKPGRDYGQVRIGGTTGQGWDRLTHRLAFEWEYGQAPGVARHTCDTPGCFNPSHIVDGTQQENMRDAVERGRFPDRRGTGSHQAKLRDDDVRMIRARLAAGEAQESIAAAFGVVQTTVSRVKLGQTYSNVA